MEREVLLSTRVHPRFIRCCIILPCPEAAEWKQKDPGASQHLLGSVSLGRQLSEPRSWKNDMFTHTSFPGMSEFGSAHV